MEIPIKFLKSEIETNRHKVRGIIILVSQFLSALLYPCFRKKIISIVSKKNFRLPQAFLLSQKGRKNGFRYWMQNLAINNNINGWVKNNSSGDVEAVIVGQNKEIQELIKLCEIGPRSAIIDRVQINDYNKNYLKESFDIF